MRAFANTNPRDLQHAAVLLRDARAAGRRASLAGGGSDVLGMVKDRLAAPDTLVNLKAVKGLDRVSQQGDGVRIGGLVTLRALAAHTAIRRHYAVLAEAAEGVAHV